MQQSIGLSNIYWYNLKHFKNLNVTNSPITSRVLYNSTFNTFAYRPICYFRAVLQPLSLHQYYPTSYTRKVITDVGLYTINLLSNYTTVLFAYTSDMVRCGN